MRALIIGGGIGGLTAALSLHAAGVEATVFESVAQIDPLGLGINLQPNAVRELIELGLGDDLAATAIETSTLAYYNKLGQRIWSEPRGLAAGYAWPQYSIHRGDLLMLLLKATRARLGADAARSNHHLLSFENGEHDVVAQFADRQTGAGLPAQRGDVLIGADGIHSAVRRQLYPNEGAPVFSGRIQWRGAVEADPFLDGRTQVMIGHREQRTVIYPMSAKAAKHGRSLVNWVALLGDQFDAEPREAWNRRVPKERFFGQFSNWNFDWIRPADLFASTADIYEFPETDRDPLPRWSFGRVTLIGDAAHPMRPVGSQAGSQAVVDARILAYALASEPGNPTGALRAYEAERLPAMNEVTLRTREFGPEIVMQMAEERAPDGFRRIEDVIPRHELESIARAFKVAAGFDPRSVNEHPSYSVKHASASG